MDTTIRDIWIQKKFDLPLFTSGHTKAGEINLTLEIIETNNCLLRIDDREDNHRYFQGYNCAQCLDKYRRFLDELDLVIGCYGAVENFYVTKGMASESFGLLGLLTEFGKTPITDMNLPIKSTFLKLENPYQLSSFKAQRSFRNSSNDHRANNLN